MRVEAYNQVQQIYQTKQFFCPERLPYGHLPFSIPISLSSLACFQTIRHFITYRRLYIISSDSNAGRTIGGTGEAGRGS